MIRGYVEHYQIEIDDTALARQAGEWALTRGGRSGRVAWQFVQDLAGRLRHKLE
jgi:predicted AAA+ superfamily ATPase